MTGIFQDVQFAFRNLAARPTFTFVALLTVALGMGANTAMFSTIDTILLRPLRYPNAEELALIWEHHPAIPFDQITTSAADFKDWRDRNKVFSRMAAMSLSSMNFTGATVPERVSVVAATGDFFTVIGSKASTGRAFGPHDASPDAPPVAVLSHGTAERLFGSESAAVGREITLNGGRHTVIGVMSPGFEFPPSFSFQNRTLLSLIHI